MEPKQPVMRSSARFSGWFGTNENAQDCKDAIALPGALDFAANSSLRRPKVETLLEPYSLSGLD